MLSKIINWWFGKDILIEQLRMIITSQRTKLDINQDYIQTTRNLIATYEEKEVQAQVRIQQQETKIEELMNKKKLLKEYMQKLRIANNKFEYYAKKK